MSRPRKTAFLERGRPVDPAALADYIAAPHGRIVVWLDIEITRRKTYHLITDEEGRTLWRAYRWSDILEWLRFCQVDAYTLRTDGASWAARVTVEFEDEEQPTWLRRPHPS